MTQSTGWAAISSMWARDIYLLTMDFPCLSHVRTFSSREMIRGVSDRSLDYWRIFFRSADDDIFHVIANAVRVAKADRPMDLITRRPVIIDALYSCDQLEELEIHEDEVQDNERKNGAQVSKESTDDNLHNKIIKATDQNLHEANDDRSDKIDEQHHTVKEVIKTKELLKNWQDESDKIVSDSLRQLQLMRLSAESLSTTDFGGVLSGSQNHRSKQIQYLAEVPTQDGSSFASEWMNMSTILQANGQDFAGQSHAKETDVIPFSPRLPCPLLDMDAQILPTELSKLSERVEDNGIPKRNDDFKSREKLVQPEYTDLVTKKYGEMRMGEPHDRPQKTMENVHGLAKFHEEVYQMQEKSSLQAFMDKATTEGNSQRRKEHADAPSAYKVNVLQELEESSKPGKMVKDARNSHLESTRTARNEDGISDDRLAKRLSQVLNGKDNAQRRPENVEVPSRPFFSIQDTPKQSKELSYWDRLENIGRMAQVDNISKGYGKMNSHIEGLRLLKRGEVSRELPTQNFRISNVDGNTQKSKEPNKTRSKTSHSLHDVCKQSKEPAYEDKMKAIKRKLPETYQELESAKKPRMNQDQSTKGDKHEQLKVQHQKNTDKRARGVV